MDIRLNDVPWTNVRSGNYNEYQTLVGSKMVTILSNHTGTEWYARAGDGPKRKLRATTLQLAATEAFTAAGGILPEVKPKPAAGDERK